MFLAKFPTVNHSAAQLLLSSASMMELLDMSGNELATSFPWLLGAPLKAANTLSNARLESPLVLEEAESVLFYRAISSPTARSDPHRVSVQETLTFPCKRALTLDVDSLALQRSDHSELARPPTRNKLRRLNSATSLSIMSRN